MEPDEFVPVRRDENQLELSLWHDSPLGVARCLGCKKTWPCHYKAWGRVDRVSRCNACGGDVIFDMPTVKTDPGYLEMGTSA